MAAIPDSPGGHPAALSVDGSACPHAGVPSGSTNVAHQRDEHRLALNAARDHAVLAAALDPIVTIDAHGVIQSVSDSVRRVFGWTPDELIGRNVNALMPEPHRAAHDGYLANYRDTGKTNILGRAREFEAVRKNGERFPIVLSVSRVDVPGSNTPLFVGIISDITERKRLENELRLIRNLALSISAATSVSDAFVETIRQIADATGWDYGELWIVTEKRESLAPAACWARPDHDYQQFSDAMHQSRFERGVGLPGRAWAEQRPIWCDDLSRLRTPEFNRHDEAREAGLNAAAAVPIQTDSETIGVLVFFVRRSRREDQLLLNLVMAAVAPLGPLIRRKQAEEALEERRLRLEDLVQERTRELLSSREQLRLADRLASIGTLAAGLGHDMNNVLLPVRARLNALRAERDRGALSDAAYAHVDAVRKSVSYLQQLADGLHYLAMDPEQEIGEDAATDLHAWWKSVGPLLSKAVPKHVRVVGKFDPSLPKINAPAHGLTQAVLNLVVNAGEAIPGPPARKRKQGMVQINAAHARDAQGGDVVRIAVSDNGVGMSDDVKRRVFEVFFTTKTRGMGTGLGLPLVHKVADRAGGSIGVESTPSVGTTFTLTFPVAVSNALAPDVRREPTIAISMRDGRAASLIRHLCESAGRAAIVGHEPGDAGVWIVDPEEVSVSSAKGWIERTPSGRLIVFRASEQRSTDDWNTLNTSIHLNNGDIDAVRAVAAEALRTVNQEVGSQ